MLEEHKEEISQEEFSTINNEIEITKKNIGKDTKNATLQKISTILAYSRKFCFELSKKMSSKFFEAISSEAGKFLFGTVIRELPKMLS
jgi:hypothetical protein